MSPDKMGYGGKSKGYPRPAGGSDKKGKGQFHQDSTQKREEGLGKNFKVKRTPSS